MPEAAYQVMAMLGRLVAPLPVGTNLGLLHLLWMLVSGRLLAARGALFPGLADCCQSSPVTAQRSAAIVHRGSAAILHTAGLAARAASLLPRRRTSFLFEQSPFVPRAGRPLGAVTAPGDDGGRG